MISLAKVIGLMEFCFKLTWIGKFETDKIKNKLHLQVCSILEETLQAIGAKAMVVGHTPQTIGVNW